jgi:hypothetical protein
VPTSVLSTTVSTSSMAASSTSNPQPTCFVVSNCEALGKSFAQACSSGSDSGKCVSGYQAKCSSQFYGTILSQTPTTPTAGDDCLSSCTNNAACLGFTFTGGFSGNYVCTLYSAIDSVGTGFGFTFRKVCDDGVSAGSSSSAASSPVLSIASTASSESVFITAITPSTSSTVDAATSASASASICPYSNDPCQPAPGATLENACALNNKCTSGYSVICGQTASDRGTIIGSRPNAISADDCALQCDQNSACFGFEYSKTNNGGRVLFTCTFYNQVTGLQTASSSTVYRKRCPGSPPIISSSNLAPSSTAPIASGILLSSSSRSSDVIIITPTPSTVPSCPKVTRPNCPAAKIVNLAPSAACPAGNDQCASGFQIKCDQVTATEGRAVISENLTPASVDQCSWQCKEDEACIAFEYAYSTRWKTFTCKYLGAVESLVPATSPGAATYFKECSATLPVVPVDSSSSVASASISSGTISSTPHPTPIPSDPPSPTLYANACPSQNTRCLSNYRVACFTSISQVGSTVITRLNVLSADACIAACNAEATCIAVQMAADEDGSGQCTLVSKYEQATVLFPRFTSFFRGCSNDAMSSGSMNMPTLDSSTLNTIASSSSVSVSSTPEPSTSSSLGSLYMSATPTPTPILVPVSGPYADACPSQNAQCVVNYRVACSTYLYAGGAIDLGVIRVPTADACVAACTANLACVAVQFTNDSQKTCALYSKTAATGPAPGPSPEIFTAFFKGCVS